MVTGSDFKNDIGISYRTLNFSQHPFGWICPNCRKIYSPQTSECNPCNSSLTGQWGGVGIGAAGVANG